MSDFEERLGRALARGAEGAPEAEGLAEGARQRRGRRRATRIGLFCAFAAGALVLPFVLSLVDGQVSDSVVAIDGAASGESADGQYRTVRSGETYIDVPQGWVEFDEALECPFARSAFGATEVTGCPTGDDAVVTIGSSVLFDPIDFGGIEEDDSSWSGFVFAGSDVVNVRSPDRDVARRVLASARTTEESLLDLSGGWKSVPVDGVELQVPSAWQLDTTGRGGCSRDPAVGWVRTDRAEALQGDCMVRGYGTYASKGGPEANGAVRQAKAREAPYPQGAWHGRTSVRTAVGELVTVEVVAPTQALARIVLSEAQALAAPAPTAVEPEVSCGGNASWPVSVMDGGVGGMVSDDPVREAFNTVLAEAPLGAPNEIRERGVLDARYIVLAVEGDEVTLGLGAWSAADGPSDGASVFSFRVAGSESEPLNWGDCQLSVAVPPGRGQVEVRAPRSGLDRDTTSPVVSVNERGCTSARDPRPFLGEPLVTETDEQVSVFITSGDLPRSANCPGNPSVDLKLDLEEPIGDREVVDAGVWPPQPLE